MVFRCKARVHCRHFTNMREDEDDTNTQSSELWDHSSEDDQEMDQETCSNWTSLKLALYLGIYNYIIQQIPIHVPSIWTISFLLLQMKTC